MASFEERIYELGAHSLAEQERRVAELRGRGATLLAAGAVIASLAASGALTHPSQGGPWERIAVFAGILGAAGLFLSTALLLWPRVVGFSLDAPAAHRSLWAAGVVEQPIVDLALTKAYEQRWQDNERVARRLDLLLRAALTALLVQTSGLVAAILLAL